MRGDNPAHVRLMTLLNVGAAVPSVEDVGSKMLGKRARAPAAEREPPAPRAEAKPKAARHAPADDAPAEEQPAALRVADDAEDEAPADAAADAFYAHFGGDSAVLAGVDLDHLAWRPAVRLHELGGALLSQPERTKEPGSIQARPHARVWTAFEQAVGRPSALQRQLVQRLGVYMDLYHCRLPPGDHESVRWAVAMHAMSHVFRTRQRVLKDNERLTRAAASAQETDADVDELPELRDQGFTRPKVLVLVPFRNAGKAWVDKLVALSACEQVEQKARFTREFTLPSGVLDKLADPGSAQRYPEDHRHTFAGNIDDNFKLGIKVTRKTLKLYGAFFESDVVLASPLGLRLLIEKEKEADYLSSIEVVIADQMDVMLMQNWEHVKFVMEHIGQIPRQAHDTDFSRVKPWYLDGKAHFLRQSVLLSAFDTPEFRHLFSTLSNVGGKLRTTPLPPDSQPSMVEVAPGVRQSFTKFDAGSVQGESDQRLTAFLHRVLPTLLRSAVSSSHTMIVVPSYFDFVRLEDHFRKSDPVLSYATLTEYSSNREVSRAREAFFSGKRDFLLVTERFHFYRRYKIRGAHTVVFYAPPEHAVYYPEFINAALDRRSEEESGVDPADVSATVLYSKYDLLRLERIVGERQARQMVTEARTSWRFA